MSSSPNLQVRFHAPTLASDAASWEKGRLSRTPLVRIRASRSVRTSERRLRLLAVARGVKSMSRVGATVGACSSPAYPPMTTYWTPRWLNAWTILRGSKRPSFTLAPWSSSWLAERPIRPRDPSRHARLGSPPMPGALLGTDAAPVPEARRHDRRKVPAAYAARIPPL